MKEILEYIFEFREDMPQNTGDCAGGVTKVEGSLDFVEILNQYPQYVTARKNFIDNPPSREETRGDKITKKYSDDVLFLTYLIEKLYIKNKKEFDGVKREPIRRGIDEALSGKNFFHTSLSELWINLFSALDLEIHIFSADGDNFSKFFNRYIALLSKLNNKKIVPFYSRWLRDVASMYTIYLNETSEDFKQMLSTLYDSLEKASNQKLCTEFTPNMDTYAIRDHIIKRIFIVKKKNKDEVLTLLCAYICDHPNEFVLIRRSPKSWHHRYYSNIKEILLWIQTQKDKIESKEIQILKFLNDNKDLLQIFSTENVSYEIKDAKIRELETALTKCFLDCFDLNYYDGDKELEKLDEEERLNVEEKTRAALGFLIAPPKRKTGEYKTKSFEAPDQFETVKYSRLYELIINPTPPYEIIIEERSEGLYLDRELEDVVDGVIKMLRLQIAIILFCQDLAKDTIPSGEEIINRINHTMNRLGIIPLPLNTAQSFNDDSFVDYCFVQCVEEMVIGKENNN